MSPPYAQHSPEGADDDDDCQSTRSETFSLSSEITDYTYENGRRYHGFREGIYYLPNDEREQNRLDMAHNMFTRLLGGRLHFAPLEERTLTRIMDIGTGSWNWYLGYTDGDKYPNAEVIGTDLSPIQPDWVPPNVKFEIDDVEDVWTWRKNSFSFIHLRSLVGSIRDWPLLLRNICDRLQPGGYVELHETDVTNPRNSVDHGPYNQNGAYAMYNSHILEASRRINCRLDLAPRLASYVRDAGFVDVVERVVPIPIGDWEDDPEEKKYGLIWRDIALDGIESYGLAPLTRVLEFDERRVTAELVLAAKELRESKNMYFNFHVIYGRKPVGDSPGLASSGSSIASTVRQ